MIQFDPGILGFAEHRCYVLRSGGPGSPCFVLESTDDPELGFVLINPWLLRADYAPELWAEDAEHLALADCPLDQLEVWAILTMASDPAQITVNLAGPLIINPLNNRGRQVVQRDHAYTTRHLVQDELHRSRSLSEQLHPALRMSG